MSSFVFRTTDATATWTSVDPKPSFAMVSTQAGLLLHIQVHRPARLAFKYTDLDNDSVTVANDSDVLGALQDAVESGRIGGNGEPLVTLDVYTATDGTPSRPGLALSSSMTTSGTLCSSAVGPAAPNAGAHTSLPRMGDSDSGSRVSRIVAAVQNTPEFAAAIQMLLPVVIKHASTLDVADEFVVLD